MPNELSVAEKNQYGTGTTLILKPNHIIYDEPTTGLEPDYVKEIISLMKSAGPNETSSIIITHDVGFEVELLGRMILLIDGKQLCRSAFARTFYLESQVKAFFK